MSLTLAPTATALGLGTSDSPTFAGLTLSGNLTWTSGTSPAISGILDHENTSSTKTYTFPDASGNVALMGFANTGSLSASTTIHAGGIIDTDATVKIKNGASNYGILTCTNNASDRTYTFPDATGTVALTSDQVWARASTTLSPTTAGDKVAFSDNVLSTGVTDTNSGFKINADVFSIETGGSEAANFDSSQTLNVTNQISWKDATSFKGILTHSNTGSDKTYTFPNTTGTVALTSQIPASFGFGLGDGTNVITTGVKRYIAYFPYAMTVTGWYIIGSPSGSIVIDIWRKALGAGVPTVADTITGSEKPTLSSQQQNSDTNLTTWGGGLNIAIGDCLAFNVDSCTSTTLCDLVIIGTRTA